MPVDRAPDDVAQGGDVTVVEERRHVRRHRLRIGEVPVAVGRGRDQEPRDIHRIRSRRVGVDPEALEDGERLQEDEALRAGR